MQQTQQRITQSEEEKENFEGDLEARVNLFEKGKQRNKLVYRKATAKAEAAADWDMHNPEYSGQNASSAGAEVKMIVYDANDPVSARSGQPSSHADKVWQSSFTYAHEEALRYLQDSANTDYMICLVANKCDVFASSDLAQYIEQAKQFSLHWLRAQHIPPATLRERINWFAVSAATGEGVMLMFREIARILRKSKSKKVEVEAMDIDKPVPEVVIIID